MIEVTYYGHHPHNMRWQAIDLDTYDGAEDSGNRHHIGWGSTRDEAIADWWRIEEERKDAMFDREEAHEKHAAELRESMGRNIFGH